MITTIELHGGPFHGTHRNTGIADDETTHIQIQFLNAPPNSHLPDQHMEIRRGHYVRTSATFTTLTFHWQ